MLNHWKERCGVVIEAGCPAVADPGAELIRLAHENNITVTPLVGPSSILLALMASGLNGQRFAFHGYLPVESAARAGKLLELEKFSISQQQTQIFIEAPYRNQKLLEHLVSVCRDTAIMYCHHLTFPARRLRQVDQGWRKHRISANTIFIAWING